MVVGAPIIEMIEMIRGQAFIPLLVLIVGAKMSRREGPRGLQIDDDAHLVSGFQQPSSRTSSVPVRGVKPGQDRMSGS